MTEEQQPDEEAVGFNETTGWVTLRDDGRVWRVKPPKLGVLRELDLLAAKLTREATAKLEQATQAVAPEDVPADVAEALAQPALHDQVEETLPWWELLLDRCGDGPLGPYDDAPIWMGGTVLISLLLTHWMTFPLRGRGAGALRMLLEPQTMGLPAR